MTITTETDYTPLTREDCRKVLRGYIYAIQKARSNCRDLCRRFFTEMGISDNMDKLATKIDEHAAIDEPALFDPKCEMLLTKMSEAVDNPKLDPSTIMNFSSMLRSLAGYRSDNPLEDLKVSMGLYVQLGLIERGYDFTENPLDALRGIRR